MEPGPLKIGNIFLSTEFKHVFCVLKRTTSLRGWDYVHLYKIEKGGYVRVGWGGYCHTPNFSNTIYTTSVGFSWLATKPKLAHAQVRKFFQRGVHQFLFFF